MFSDEFRILTNIYDDVFLRKWITPKSRQLFSRKIHLHVCRINCQMKWWNTLKQFVGCCRRIVLVCLTTLRGWCLNGWETFRKHYFLKILFVNLKRSWEFNVCKKLLWRKFGTEPERFIQGRKVLVQIQLCVRPGCCEFVLRLLVTFGWHYYSTIISIMWVRWCSRW